MLSSPLTGETPANEDGRGNTVEEYLKRVGEGALGGLISGTILLAAYLLATANMNGADGGDWLAFAGVVVGVGATITGTLAIDRLKDRRAHKAATASLLHALDLWAVTVDTTATNLNPARFNELRRPEEHTSELQSLMRIYYHVFCWDKTNYTTTTQR